MTTRNNDPHLFPALNPSVLKSFAHSWAAYWTFMERIVLYRPSVLEEDYRKKYLLHFELSEISYEYQATEEHPYKHPDMPAILKRADRGFIDLLEGPDALIWLKMIPGNKFKDAYTVTPADNFFDEWRFTTELPENIDTENRWVLFERETEETADCESIIRSLTVFSENDSEIRIQEQGKKAVPYDCTALGFKNSNTKEWKALRELLQRFNHKIFKKSDAERKRWDGINAKLVQSFRKFFRLGLPEGYKLYERDLSEEKAVVFKFQIVNRGRIQNGFNERAEKLERIENLSAQYRKTKPENQKQTREILRQLEPLWEDAGKMGWLTQDEATKLLDRNQPELYDPHEND